MNVLELIEAVRDTRLAAVWYEFKMLSGLATSEGYAGPNRAVPSIPAFGDGDLDAPAADV